MFDPNKNYGYASGIGDTFSMLDNFAATVLPAVYAKHNDMSDEDVALIAYNIADAMMRQRKNG